MRVGLGHLRCGTETQAWQSLGQHGRCSGEGLAHRCPELGRNGWALMPPSQSPDIGCPVKDMTSGEAALCS